MIDVIEKPLVTFALFTYNQERYIREAVEAALAQDYSNLEIIISDDASSDRTFDLIEDALSSYAGPHKIIARKNPRNLGIGGHIDAVFSIANGQYIVMAAGDDISVPVRVSRVVDLFLGDPGLVGVVSALEYIDEASSPTGDLWVPDSSSFTLEKFSRGKIEVHGASSSWKRGVLTSWGLDGVIHEDRVIPFRALIIGGRIGALSDALVLYRKVGGITKKSSSVGPIRARYNNIIRIIPDAKARLADYRKVNSVSDGVYLNLVDYLNRLESESFILGRAKRFWWVRYLREAIRFRSIEMISFFARHILLGRA